MRKKINKTTRVILVAAFASAAIIVVIAFSYFRQMAINDDLADAVGNGRALCANIK